MIDAVPYYIIIEQYYLTNMKLKQLALILVAAIVPQVVVAQQSKADPSVEFNPYWYGQAQVGIGHTIGEADFTKLLSPAAALNVGYQFAPAWGVRVGVGGWQAKGAVVNPHEMYKFKYLDGHIDLTFDWLTAIKGYDHSRKSVPYFLIGFGGLFGWDNGAATVTQVVPQQYFRYLWGEARAFIMARAGLGYEYFVTDRLALGAECNVDVTSDKFNSKRAGNPDFQINALVGVKYAFGDRSRVCEKYVADQAAAAAAAAALKAERDRIDAEAAAARKAAEKEAADKAAELEAARQALEEEAAAQAATAMTRYTFFALNSAEITEAERYRLVEFANWLNENPELRLCVTGYADKETGNPKINQDLSERRAAAVKALLVKCGVDASRIDSVAKGDTEQPFAENEMNRVVISAVTK